MRPTVRGDAASRRATTLVAALASATLAGVGCVGNPLYSGGEGGTQIRLLNSSNFTLTEVVFSPGLQEPLRHSRIDPGSATPYSTVPFAYRYGYLDMLVDGVRRVIQPIDYDGERHIGEGRFTYVITIDPRTLSAGTRLVRAE